MGERARPDPQSDAGDTRTAELDEQTFAGVRDRIQAYSGIYLDESRRRSLARLLNRRMARRGMRAWSEYLRLLDSDSGAEEIAALLEEVVNHETHFFRNPRHFRLLAEVVLVELDRLRPAQVPLRLWSAGCSTGQEAYSLAITVAETLGLPPRRPVEIVATDISRKALEYARQGLYTAREVERIEPDYRQRYFQAEGQGLRVKPALRDLVRFENLNLIAEPLPPLVRGMDVVFCRNVTIYFQVETCRRLMAQIYRCLNDGGYLFIGFSETLWQIFEAFERVQQGGVFFYRKGPAGQAEHPRREKWHPRSVPGGGSVERPLHLGPLSPRPAAPAPRVAPPETAAADPARSHYHRGMTCLRDGAYPEALRAFQAALQEEPNLVEAYCGIAQVHANQNRYAEALRSCERALEVDDLAEEAYLLRGLIYRQMGRNQESIADLERATLLNPSSATAHFHLGNAFLALPDHHRALESFRRTLRALLGRPEEALIDGVPVRLLRETCQRHIETLAPSGAMRSRKVP